MEVENGSCRNEEDTPLGYKDKAFPSILFLSLAKCFDSIFYDILILVGDLQVAQLKELAKKPDIYDRLTRSLAPNIWELDDVKKGLLCQVPYSRLGDLFVYRFKIMLDFHYLVYKY